MNGQCHAGRRHSSRLAWLAAVAVVGLGAGACGGDDDDDASNTTIPATETTATPDITSTSAPAAADSATIESLSYLLQGLLTTDQIGNGWVDQGRNVIPPGSDQRTGFLCPDGQAIADPLASAFDPQVRTRFRRASDPGLTAGMALLWGDQQDVRDGFDAWSSAVEACLGQEYETSDMGRLRLEPIDVELSFDWPVIAYALVPVVDGTDPSAEIHAIEVLGWDGESDVALVMGVDIVAVRDTPETESLVVDDAELVRVTEAAVARIQAGL